ncbi:MAG: substrate-binding domain-containing protein, partial [Devosiaceae bacterium]|nr:substrate-binding domain-containing protein [Devosiaceae bacterium]
MKNSKRVLRRVRKAACLALATTTLVSASFVANAQEGFEVAYLSASSANTWLGASVIEMQKVAEANGIKITEFDAQFDPGLQTSQFQDAIASGKYDGIVLVSINGPGAIPDVELAISEGIEIVILNQVVGTDLKTSDPQVDGIAASVMAAPYRSGERFGQLTIQACQDINPCEVVFIYGIKGIPLDDA